MKKKLRTEMHTMSYAVRQGWKIMKLVIVLLTAAIVQTHANSFAQLLNLDAKNKPLTVVFKEIEQQTGYVFFWDTDLNQQRVTIRLKDEMLSDALKKLFQLLPYTYQLEEKSVIVRERKAVISDTPETVSQQLLDISGNVTDSSKVPLVGASIHVKGVSKGTLTDASGKYAVSGVMADATLVISYLGFETLEVPINGRKSINIQLKADDSKLEEVVVTALGIKREEKSLGYAVQKVSGAELQTVKGVDAGTSLSGRVSGLVVQNSTEFNAKPTLELRGETPLIVIDGVPYGNMTLRDIPTDAIADITVLKGATASALYGSRGGSGAIIISTKKGLAKGFSVEVNSNTMTQMGFLAIPKVQTSYAHGINGEIADDYVWGPKLDIGQTAEQWNPVSKQYEEMPLVSSGKDNLKNFLETGIITNNSVAITQTGENGFFRTSLNHIYNKGQYPNTKLNIINFNNSGQMKLGNKVTIDAQTGYTRQTAPQTWGTGYGNQGYLYQILMWTGPDYDIRQYKDYWITPDQKQNWLYDSWYDNPYLIANEKLNGINQNKLYASFSTSYQITKELNLLFRTGYDFYSNMTTMQNPIGINSNRSDFYVGPTYVAFNSLGTYGINKDWGFSTNNDLILTYNKTFGKFALNALGGGTIYYYNDRSMDAATQNGLSVPGWYSLGASQDKAIVAESEYRRQINSVYAKASLSWDDAIYVDVTGRNDWSTTQGKSERSYFYPSVATSFILSNYLTLPKVFDMVKLRGSWAVDKSPLDVYANSRTYSVTPGAWDTYNTASYPGGLLGNNLLANSHRTYEFGGTIDMFQRRISLDVTYFNKYYYNQQRTATISSASGFSSTLINIGETNERRGWELVLSGTPIRHANFEWKTVINWSNNHQYYVDLDPTYSADDLWTKKGARLDAYKINNWDRDPDGNLIHVNGIPKGSDFQSQIGYSDPDYMFGFINNFRMGNFNLGISIDGRIGGLMYNYIWDKMFDTGANPETDNQYRYDAVVNGLSNYVGQGVKLVSGEATYDKYGHITNDTRIFAPNDVPVYYQDYMQELSGGGDHGIQNQSFVKLREISIGYSVPAKYLSGTVFKNASISLTGQNVLLFTKFKFSDPDIFTENLNSPSQRMLGINIKMGF
ncbi:TonB-linked outer membrane protein, SusC/RagA family [bacterium A37T11]|nr:TonB-linked outer membrane protein, SusC/RagA family [bacterium A37T11]